VALKGEARSGWVSGGSGVGLLGFVALLCVLVCFYCYSVGYCTVTLLYSVRDCWGVGVV
jgi:hypothetical protein